MNRFDTELEQQLDALRGQGLGRELRRVDSPQSTRLILRGQALLNFSSNDYLGLANDPVLKAAAQQAIEKFGAGAGASRLICGSLAPHHELEETLAHFKGTDAALSFSSGYATALGTIGALLDKDDLIVLDRLVHACIVDAARLCGAKLRVFAHNDLNDLADILRWAAEVQTSKSRNSSRRRRVLVVTESVFSMDGDQAPLRELVELKDQYGAWLMVDEAHATGLFGQHRRGLAEGLGVSDRIEIQMGTLGKALGTAGGYICGSRRLIDLLVNRARSFVFSTAPLPCSAAAATAAIAFVASEAGAARCQQLWQNVKAVLRCLSTANVPPHLAPSAIIPLMIGDEANAVAASAKLRAQGLFIPAIRYPAVARRTARLRLTVTATHTAADIAQLQSALKALDFRHGTWDS